LPGLLRLEVGSENDSREAAALAVILLVDDDPMVRNITTELLEVSGHEVLGAENGAQALAILDSSARQIDLVLLDLFLPDMDGRELLRRIVRVWPVRIVICTGSTYDHDSELISHPAVKAVLRKPFNLRTLQEAVRSSLAA
jgi:CheY-like chemotaxis protein